MLKKTVEWDFIMEAVAEKLRKEGLEVVRTVDEEGRIGDGYMELEVKVVTAWDIMTTPQIRPHLFGQDMGGRGIMDTPTVCLNDTKIGGTV